LILKNSSAENTNIVRNIVQCIQAVKDIKTFEKGIHEAHAFSSIYFMEKTDKSELSLYLNHIEDGYLPHEEDDGYYDAYQ